MKKQIIISTKNEQINRQAAAFFSDHGFMPLVIERKKILAETPLIITEDAVRFGPYNLLENTGAALILDSGYMWPQPYIKPSPEEWSSYQHNLDEYLRNERETASFWNSFLDIINSVVQVCINPQAGFDAAAFKPRAFAELQRRGIPVPPYTVTNDYALVDAFTESLPALYRVPLACGEQAGWCSRDDLREEEKTQAPLFLQALTTQDEAVLWALNGGIFYSQGAAGTGNLPVKAIQETLHLPLAELHFRYHNGWVLSDFCAAPSLEKLTPPVFDDFCRRMLELPGITA